MSFKIDFHVHTKNSKDAFGSLEEISFYAKRRGINSVVISDHEKFTIDKVQEIDGVFFIPAIEIRTFAGHMVCVYPKVQFDVRRAYSDPVKFIHGAGGYAVWAHPYDLFFFKKGRNLLKPDAIEVYNSASFPFRSSSNKALKLAELLNLPKVAGSDAHLPKNVGLCYVEVKSDSVSGAITEVFKGRGVPYGQAWSIIDSFQLNALRMMRIVNNFI
ncbi:MAG: PHP domain-containing protein [Nitrososphaeria archaeon]